MKRTTRVKCAALAAVGTTLLAACGTESGTGHDTIVDGEKTTSTTGIADVEWVPQKVTVDGKEYVLPKNAEDAHIGFAPGTADPDVGGGDSGGSVGCNSIGADAEIDGDTVRITDLVQTLMGCPDPLGAFEAQFTSVFEGTHKAKVTERDGTRTLTLTSQEGDTITLREKAPPALKGTRWVIDTKAHLTLGKDDTVTGSLGCNTFRGEAVVKGGVIDFGRLATTRMTCGPAAMKTERELAGILSGKVSYQQKRDSLRLTAASGESVTARAE
ncbi:META domain-containing protein [Streptomyces sp. SID13726]|uniref:META domain-containing protein n=1 Tax=Streptomyces sp. SID13726 TaxID=2706058 RepID=UPI0013B83F26|nr:META domain-containing protein [Streptomyces sp. SID13726]NEB05312.1 META domain-containing protein [Streptomyces sp. SID13726]